MGKSVAKIAANVFLYKPFHLHTQTKYTNLALFATSIFIQKQL